MLCPLCVEGHSLRDLNRPTVSGAGGRKRGVETRPTDLKAVAAENKRAKYSDRAPSERIFVGALPLVINATMIREALGGGVKLVHWITDRTTGLWYGNTFLEMKSIDEAKRVVESANTGPGIRLGKRRLKINFAIKSENDVWPPPNYKHLERPPYGA